MIRWIVLQRGGTLQERVPPYLRAFADIPFTEQVKTAYLDLVSSRLSAAESLLYNLVCTPIRRGLPFARAKGSKTRSGRPPRPPTLGCAGYEYCFSAAAEKQIRTARRCAPKVACGGIFIARALEREGRTTSPLPSSKEGNYGGSRLILLGLLICLYRGKANAINPSGSFHSPPPLHRGGYNYCWRRRMTRTLISAGETPLMRLA